MFRDSVARFCGPPAVRACRKADSAILATASGFHAEFARGIKDSRADEDRTIHTFARTPSEGRGVLAGGLHAVLRLLFSWRTFPFSDPAAGLGGQVSRRRRKCQRQEMDSRIGLRPAAFPDPRRFETARAHLLARAFPALRAVDSRLGLVALGLDQRRVLEHSIWDRSGADPVCRNEAQPAALVAVLLVSRGPDSLRSDRDRSAGDRSAVRQIRALE